MTASGRPASRTPRPRRRRRSRRRARTRRARRRRATPAPGAARACPARTPSARRCRCPRRSRRPRTAAAPVAARRRSPRSPRPRRSRWSSSPAAASRHATSSAPSQVRAPCSGDQVFAATPASANGSKTNTLPSRAAPLQRGREQVGLDRGGDGRAVPLEQRRDRQAGGLARLRRPERDQRVAVLGVQQPAAVAAERQPRPPQPRPRVRGAAREDRRRRPTCAPRAAAPRAARTPRLGPTAAAGTASGRDEDRQRRVERAGAGRSARAAVGHARGRIRQPAREPYEHVQQLAGAEPRPAARRTAPPAIPPHSQTSAQTETTAPISTSIATSEIPSERCALIPAPACGR